LKTTPKYISAFAIVGIIYLSVYYWLTTLTEDEPSIGVLFLLLFGTLAGLIGGGLSIQHDETKASLTYLSICLFNILFIIILIGANFSPLALIFLPSVLLGLLMLFLHIKALRAINNQKL